MEYLYHFILVLNEGFMVKKKKGVAEKSGEVVGKGLQKGWGIAKGFGKGLKKGLKKKKK